VFNYMVAVRHLDRDDPIMRELATECREIASRHDRARLPLTPPRDIFLGKCDCYKSRRQSVPLNRLCPVI
jgi:hypothetical protein